MLTRLILVITSQCTQILNHVVYLKLVTLYVNHTSKKKKERDGGDFSYTVTCNEYHALLDVQSIVESSVQFSSIDQLCSTLCDPMDCSRSGLPVHHQLLEFTQTHVHWVSDAIQPSHPLLSLSPAFNLSQHQGLFKWVSSSHQVAKVLEFQLQH